MSSRSLEPWHLGVEGRGGREGRKEGGREGEMRVWFEGGREGGKGRVGECVGGGVCPPRGVSAGREGNREGGEGGLLVQLHTCKVTVGPAVHEHLVRGVGMEGVESGEHLSGIFPLNPPLVVASLPA